MSLKRVKSLICENGLCRHSLFTYNLFIINQNSVGEIGVRFVNRLLHLADRGL